MNIKPILLLFFVLRGFALYPQHSLEEDVNVTPLTIYEDTTLVAIHENVGQIMTEAIHQQAFPGAQLMVMRKGEVLFHETYGYHTYDSLIPVGHNDLYDLASVTKIAGPLPALMQLVDEGVIDLDAPFSTYWPDWSSEKDKKDLTLRSILAHQAGLQSYIVFAGHLKNKRGEYKRKYIRNSQSRRFPVKLTEGMYLSRRFKEHIYDVISGSAVKEEKAYLYSGLSFLIYPELISQLTGEPYRNYLRTHVYEPIGAHSLMFQPEGWYPQKLIVPTENDTIFRQRLVQGSVHDENASLMGGVSGNAGLFGTAEDLARLMQMYLQNGRFNGRQIISASTMEEFTAVQYPENENRRGLGFDKPVLDNSGRGVDAAYPAPGASAQSFGHTGFTGTLVWADPVGDWVFVFLSNRVYPYRSHRSLYELNIRGRLMQVFYEAYNN